MHSINKDILYLNMELCYILIARIYTVTYNRESSVLQDELKRAWKTYFFVTIEVMLISNSHVLQIHK